MDRSRRAGIVALAALVVGCGSERVTALESASGPATAPAEPAALHSWLTERAYLDWPAWPEVQPSTFADGGARVFWSPGLHRSLLAGSSRHPVGASAVRELYEDDLRTLRGWSATVKVADAGVPEDWLFFEVFSPNAAAQPAVADRGFGGCLTCHDSDLDFVQSDRR